jgi:hypothetical protein
LYFPQDEELPIKQQIKLPLAYSNDSHLTQPTDQQSNWHIQLNLGANEHAKNFAAEVFIQIEKYVRRLTNLSEILQNKENLFHSNSSAYFTIKNSDISDAPLKQIAILLDCIQKGSWLLKNVILTQPTNNIQLTFECHKFMRCEKPGQKLEEQFDLQPESPDQVTDHETTIPYLKIILPPVMVVCSTIIVFFVRALLKRLQTRCCKKTKNKKSMKVTPVQELEIID